MRMGKTTDDIMTSADTATNNSPHSDRRCWSAIRATNDAGPVPPTTTAIITGMNRRSDTTGMNALAVGATKIIDDVVARTTIAIGIDMMNAMAGDTETSATMIVDVMCATRAAAMSTNGTDGIAVQVATDVVHRRRVLIVVKSSRIQAGAHETIDAAMVASKVADKTASRAVSRAAIEHRKRTLAIVAECAARVLSPSPCEVPPLQ